LKTVTETANGTTIALDLNASVELQLPEARTSGYRWTAEDAGAPVVQIEDRGTTLPHGRTGGQALHVWLLTARQPGEVRLRLRQSRPWEPAGSGTLFTITLSVRP